MLKIKRKQHPILLLYFSLLIVGCSDSDSDTTGIVADNLQQNAPVSEMSDEMSGENEDTSETADSNSNAEGSTENSPSERSLFDPLSEELIEPLLADIQPGSALSATNYPTFLSAYYRLSGSQLMQTLGFNMDAVSNEIRAAMAGETSRFVAESVAADTGNILQATLVCPDGGRVSVMLNTEPVENGDLFTQAIYGDYRDTIIYDGCSVDGFDYNGLTKEHQTTLFENLNGRTASRRFGGFVYSGGATGSNQFTNHPDGFGDADDQFTISNSRGTSALLFTQQSTIHTTPDPDSVLYRWHGNWQLQDDDQSMTMEKMNIAVVKSSQGRDALITSVSPFFTLTGNVTNGRVITAVNQGGVSGIEGERQLTSARQAFSDAEGGVLDLTVVRDEPDQPESNIVLRIDTEGQILNPVLPVDDEALLMINIL